VTRATCPTGFDTTADRAHIRLVGEHDPGVIWIISNAVYLQFARRRLYGKRALFDWPSTCVLQWISTDGWWKRQGRLVLAHGIEGSRWDRNRQVFLSRPERDRLSELHHRPISLSRAALSTRMSPGAIVEYQRSQIRREVIG
jgi:hypothetical protein